MVKFQQRYANLNDETDQYNRTKDFRRQVLSTVYKDDKKRADKSRFKEFSKALYSSYPKSEQKPSKTVRGDEDNNNNSSKKLKQEANS